MELEGILHFWSETGTEGGYWALQDQKFILPPTKDWPHERWSYDGLHVLEDGNLLTIFSKDHGGVVWSGIIKLKTYQVFTESSHGMWIHSDQEGIKREEWSKWFFEEYPAKLVKGKPRS